MFLENWYETDLTIRRGGWCNGLLGFGIKIVIKCLRKWGICEMRIMELKMKIKSRIAFMG